jgi:hypothetical protein
MDLFYCKVDISIIKLFIDSFDVELLIGGSDDKISIDSSGAFLLIISIDAEL